MGVAQEHCAVWARSVRRVRSPTNLLLFLRGNLLLDVALLLRLPRLLALALLHGACLPVLLVLFLRQRVLELRFRHLLVPLEHRLGALLPLLGRHHLGIVPLLEHLLRVGLLLLSLLLRLLRALLLQCSILLRLLLVPGNACGGEAYENACSGEVCECTRLERGLEVVVGAPLVNGRVGVRVGVQVRDGQG